MACAAAATCGSSLGSRTLRRAADDYDRAARQPWGRIPAPTPAGNQLRHAARPRPRPGGYRAEIAALRLVSPRRMRTRRT